VRRPTARTYDRRYYQPRHAETRRPQVRYYYYRNGRQVTFSEAFR
jgi:hypothetical protein